VDIVGTVGRRPERRSFQATGVSFDSRTLAPGQVFFALPGTRSDGHAHVDEALAKGAAAVVVQREVAVAPEVADRLVRVDDTLAALCATARARRRRWGGTVIGVTGSNGKTTLREMLYHILSGAMGCKRSPQSYNTNIGLSCTLFLPGEDDRVLIAEMGANGFGELTELCEIAAPDLGVITNIGESHLEGLGSVEGVARAKSELLRGLPEEGTAFLSADDDWCGFLRERAPENVVTFGLGFDADFRARAVRPIPGGFWFLVGRGVEVTLRTPGLHNVYNAAAALAVAHHLGVDLASAAKRLESFRPPPMRFEVEDVGGVTVVCDCYNANPGSMRAAQNCR
jgi:UDP-N-acetylmuramoyl-tripeptide--D-alanyl-D-alanine ligase